MGQMCCDSYMLVASGPAWRSFIQIYRERPDTGGKHSSALKMINSLQHQPKPTRVTSCFNLDPFLRLFKVWPACPDLGWRQRGHIAANSALPLHLSRWYPAKAAGLFRQAPAPAESPILKFKPRVNFLFSADSETNYLYSPSVIPFPCIGKALQHRLFPVTWSLVFCAAFVAVLVLV